MSSYCCFMDPEKTYAERKLDDVCPICGEKYSYPLDNMPVSIVNGDVVYEVEEAIGRGFYGATYRCKKARKLGKAEVLLKVIPVKVYKLFGKNFEQECIEHYNLAEDTDHIIGINEYFDTDITFGKWTLKCHVAELEFVKGRILSKFIEEEKESYNVSRIFAQIAIDLIALQHELARKQKHHNDLHMGNLMVKELGDTQRPNALYGSIKVMAIDLNSVKDESQSVDGRKGDYSWIGSHIKYMENLIREKYANNPDKLDDAGFRLMEVLNLTSSIVSTPPASMDKPQEMMEELIEIIKASMISNVSYAPWEVSNTKLSKFSDGINAQTLTSHMASKLMVDPDEKWLKAVSVQGPQLITGMRGCGKTMLLRALDIHARLPQRNKGLSFDNDEFSKDGFIGLFASCKSLVNIEDIETKGIAKLFFLYAEQAIRAVRHLRFIDTYAKTIDESYWKRIALLLNELFGCAIETEKATESIVETKIKLIMSGEYELCKGNYIDAFEKLAEIIKSSADSLKNKTVFFLLDDASTRHLQVDKIEKLLTIVMAQNSLYAFKVTTELQTLYGFRSLGNIEKADAIRDYRVFDLGKAVYEETINVKSGIKFIENIINKRLVNLTDGNLIPRALPLVLGNATKKDIARNIANGDRNPYYGASALAAVCVGDIGDILLLYDKMLAKSHGKYPIPKNSQSQCYTAMCSSRHYEMGHRDNMQNYINAFSQASYLALVDSVKNGDNKVRQYSELHIKMSDDTRQGIDEKLRKLIDSGIFVIKDSTGWGRRYGNSGPDLLTKLTFRKLLGLSANMPLGNSDRFELSGEELTNWLDDPNKELLLASVGANDTSLSDDELLDDDEYICDEMQDGTQLSISPEMLKIEPESGNEKQFDDIHSGTVESIKGRFSISQVEMHNDMHFSLGIFANGFETRCAESMLRISKIAAFDSIIMLNYGDGCETGKAAFGKHKNLTYIGCNETDQVLSKIAENDSVLVDISGMNKELIFKIIREGLLKTKKITVLYTAAQNYYPSDDDIKKVFEKYKLNNGLELSEIMRELKTGDADGYDKIGLMQKTLADETRPTGVIGFVTPKNQRIFDFIRNSDYENISLLVPEGSTQRDEFAKRSGEIAASNFINVQCVDFNDEINSLVDVIVKKYYEIFVANQSNLDFALTGTKTQAMICAALSAVCRISQCWYMKPKKYDEQFFTEGVGESHMYEIMI